MPWMTEASRGAVAWMRWASWSTPPAVYRSRHGLRHGSRVAHDSMIDENPMSLPPMPRVTTVVSAVRPSNWGGFGPGQTPCSPVMSPVSAPLQLRSTNRAEPDARAGLRPDSPGRTADSPAAPGSGWG